MSFFSFPVSRFLFRGASGSASSSQTNAGARRDEKQQQDIRQQQHYNQQQQQYTQQQQQNFNQQQQQQYNQQQQQQYNQQQQQYQQHYNTTGGYQQVPNEITKICCREDGEEDYSAYQCHDLPGWVIFHYMSSLLSLFSVAYHYLESVIIIIVTNAAQVA